MKQTSFSYKPRKCDVDCVCSDQRFAVSLYTRIHCLLRDVAEERITSFSDKDNASNSNFLKNEIQFSRWKLKPQTTVLHIRCVTRL
jgi:hypothetical protein